MSSAESELARVISILGAPEAEGRERLAVHLALNTTFSADDARACLIANAGDHPSPAIVAAMAESAAAAAEGSLQ